MYIVEETWDENNYTSDYKSYNFSNEQYNIIDLKTIFIILLSLKLAHASACSLTERYKVIRDMSFLSKPEHGYGFSNSTCNL